MTEPFAVGDPITEPTDNNLFEPAIPPVSVSPPPPQDDHQDEFSEIIIKKPDDTDLTVSCRFEVVVEADNPVTVDVFANGKQVTRDDSGSTGTKKLAHVIGTKTYTGVLSLCGLAKDTWLTIVFCDDLPPPHHGICDYVQKKLGEKCPACREEKPSKSKRAGKAKAKVKAKPMAKKKAKPAAKPKPAKAKPAKAAKKAKPAAKKKKAKSRRR